MGPIFRGRPPHVRGRPNLCVQPLEASVGPLTLDVLATRTWS